MKESLQSRIYAQLEQDPDGRALAFVDDEGGFEWRSRADLIQRAGRTAAVLREEGLRPGSVAIIVLRSEEHAPDILLAVLLAGGVPLLVAPPAIQARARFSSLSEVVANIVQRTEPSLVVADESLRPDRERLIEAGPGTRFLFAPERLDQEAGDAEVRETPGGEDVAALQLTSGTTGFPRICMWRHRGVLASLDGMEQAMALTREDVCLNWTPLYHDMGLVNNFFLCLAKGVPLVLLSPQDFVRRPALWLKSIADTGATVSWSPNFGFSLAAERIADEELEGLRLDHVKALWNAAEKIHAATIDRFVDRFRPYGLKEGAVKTNFGCAENVGGATFSDPHGSHLVETIDRAVLAADGIAEPIDGDDGTDRAVRVVGVGRPCPGMSVEIRSPTDGPLPDGHVGELVLDTPSQMEQYLDDAEETGRTLRDGLLWTGDLAYKRGQEVFWIGRVRERINSMGRKFDPSDFEAPLLSVPALRPGCFAVFGVDDTRSGSQKIVVVSEVRHGQETARREIILAVKSAVTQRVGAHVNEVLLVPTGTLAKTSSGKRRHRHFRGLYDAGELQALAL